MIFYSLPGEGLGHAARTQAVIEHLDAEIHVFTWGEAYNFFKSLNYPHLHQISGIPFGRNSKNYISILRTIKNFAKYLKSAKESIKEVEALARKLKPKLLISDFEPVIPRVAKRLSLPLLSVDNQHKFSRCTYADLPRNLKMYARIMGIYTEWVCPKPNLAIISTFHHSDIKQKYPNTVLTNCFMRKSIEAKKPTTGDYLLLYYKSSVGPEMLQALLNLKQKLIVFNCPLEKRIFGGFNSYGLVENTTVFPVEYRELSSEGFIEALAGCKCLFSSAGNQLLGEALYYGKPTFAIPEPNQKEQEINAHFLSKMGGKTCKLSEFASQLPDFIQNAQPMQTKENGVHFAIAKIKEYL